MPEGDHPYRLAMVRVVVVGLAFIALLLTMSLAFGTTAAENPIGMAEFVSQFTLVREDNAKREAFNRDYQGQRVSWEALVLTTQPDEKKPYLRIALSEDAPRRQQVVASFEPSDFQSSLPRGTRIQIEGIVQDANRLGIILGKCRVKRVISAPASVFENRTLRELDPPPLTSNSGVQAIVLTESHGQDVDKVLAIHAGRVECLVDLVATPSGFMGDLGEAAVKTDTGRSLDGIRAMAGSDGGTRFVFVATGEGPHEWDLKYHRNGRLNPKPANFGGCAYLRPSNNWGDRLGTDLRQLRPTRIVWEARKLSAHDCPVECFVGSDGFVWQEDENGMGRKVTPDFPESLPRLGLRNQVMAPAGPLVVPLSHEWQTFYDDLAFSENDPRLSNVNCLFGWVIRDPHADYKEYEFEVRNIRFVRE